nr:MAG TPA: Neuromedin U [Caudoviricetes sp.]
MSRYGKEGFREGSRGIFLPRPGNGGSKEDIR